MSKACAAVLGTDEFHHLLVDCKSKSSVLQLHAMTIAHSNELSPDREFEWFDVATPDDQIGGAIR